MTVRDPVAELYQAPLDGFVEKRKQLAAELKAAGDKAGAAALAKRPRPTVSAWTVDQLHWRARAELDAMFDSAARLREGKLDATAAHRDALAALRVRAAEILRDAGHATTEATLRRVMTTISALAAAGGWDPDPPGALAEDRDPPGFAGVGVIAAPPPKAAAAPEPDREAIARAEREAAARRAAERDKLRFQLKAARAELASREREVEIARGAVADLEAQLAALEESPS